MTAPSPDQIVPIAIFSTRMTRHMTLFKTTALTSAFALCAGPALADLTSAQVWTDWQALFESYGMTVATDGQSASGNTLTVTGITLTTDVEPEGTMSMSFGDISFVENGDGTVDIQMPEVLPFTMDVTNPEGERATIGMVLRQPGLKLTASGDDSHTRYDYDAPEIGLSDFTIDATDMPDDFAMDFDLVATGNTGFFDVTAGDLRSYESVTSTDSMRLDMNFTAPESEGGGDMALQFEMADMEQETSGQIGQVAMDMSLSEMIAGGMRQVGMATYGPMTYSIAADTPDGAFNMAAAAEGGSIGITINEGGFGYDVSSLASTMTVAADAMPLPPLSFAVGESAVRFAVPVVPGEESQNLDMAIRLVDLQVDDMLWNMIDPGESLPRDPATLIIDLAGMVTVTEDFTDPEFAETPGAAPGQIDALTVNQIQLSIAGAQLLGDGNFTFNNDFGVPMPAGVANLSLTGANTLMDKLVVMGLLPQEQAMGARMMLGMFARPGQGEDSLVSTIEMKEDGSILANGQRIK